MLYDLRERVLALERSGRAITKLNIGDPDLPVDPRITEATIAALKKGESHYESSAGLPELRAALAERHGVEAEQVVVTTGSKLALFGMFSLLLRPGDKAAVPTPHWTAIELMLRHQGAVPLLLKTTVESGWQPSLAQIEDALAGGAKLVLLTTPGNPTSTVAPRELLEGAIELCGRAGVRLVTDEAYAELAFKRCPSAMGRAMVVKSFSKTFSMPGYRIGYTVADRELAKKLADVNARTITSLPGFIQLGALRAVELWDEIAERARETYERRARAALKALRGPGLRIAEPQAGFYVFPELASGDGAAFCSRLLDQGVALTPGAAFGDFPHCFRISLTAPEPQLEAALSEIARLAQALTKR